MYVSIQWDGRPKGRTRESVIKTAKVFNIQMVVQTDLIKVSFYKTVITRFERFIWYFFGDIRFRSAPIWYRKPNTFALIIPKLLKFVGVWELLSAMCHRRNVLISFHSSERFINLEMFSWCSTIGVLAGSFIPSEEKIVVFWKKKFFANYETWWIIEATALTFAGSCSTAKTIQADNIEMYHLKMSY